MNKWFIPNCVGKIQISLKLIKKIPYLNKSIWSVEELISSLRLEIDVSDNVTDFKRLGLIYAFRHIGILMKDSFLFKNYNISKYIGPNAIQELVFKFCSDYFAV